MTQKGKSKKKILTLTMKVKSVRAGEYTAPPETIKTSTKSREYNQ